MVSVIVPVYRNESSLDRLVAGLERIGRLCPVPLEVVFVIDGSPDGCQEILRRRLPDTAFAARLVSLSRNFGSFNAILAGLEVASGNYFAVLSADLQEPPDLVLQFLDTLRRDEADVVFGVRATRADPFLDEAASRLFWSAYRRFVLPELPRGGVDVFGCNRIVRDRIVQFREANANLIGLLFWVGYRRTYVSYTRRPRLEGRSAWTFGKRLRYAIDSVFNFTDLPIRLLLTIGTLGTVIAVVFAIVLIGGRLLNLISVPGYTATVLTVTFFGSITSLGLGILGQYLWLVLQNSRQRPNFLIERVEDFAGRGESRE